MGAGPGQRRKQRQHLLRQFLDDLPRRALRHLNAQCGVIDPGLAPFVQQVDQAVAAGAQHIATLLRRAREAGVFIKVDPLVGVEPDRRSRRGPSFDEDLLLLSAAASGQGIALVQAQHAQEHLRSGRLVVALERPWPARFAYYLVARKENLERAQVRAFVDWIRGQIEPGHQA